MIQEVEIHSLKRFIDHRGKVLRMLRRDDSYFKEFGEIYFSVVSPRTIKAWRLHKKMTSNLAVIAGNVRLVLCDQRTDSSTQGEIQELEIGEDNYQLVIIPPGIAYGFRAIGDESAILANCATCPHDPNEVEKIDPTTSTIPYRWED